MNQPPDLPAMLATWLHDRPAVDRATVQRAITAAVRKHQAGLHHLAEQREQQLARGVPAGDVREGRTKAYLAAIWSLARQLKFANVDPGINVAACRPVTKWFHVNQLAPIAGNREELDTWAEFGVAWDKAQMSPDQSPVIVATRYTEQHAPPATLARYNDDPPLFRLARLCWAMEETKASASPWWLGYRDAGAALGVDHTRLGPWFKQLDRDGITAVVAPGDQAKRKSPLRRFIGYDDSTQTEPSP